MAQLSRWREQLVDLSRRNRLVNLTRTKTSTVTVVAPSLGAVLTGLHAGDGWRFHYPPPEPGEGDTVARAALLAEDPDLDDVHHPDELMTDAPSADRLSLTLRGLERRATQERMDRGLNVLYLAVGLLEWTDTAGDQVHSPLLLVPVELGRASPNAPFRLRTAGDDPVANPALAIKLGKESDVVLPSYDLDAEDPGHYIDLVRKAVRSTSWTVTEAITLSYFWFQKEAMYRDLLDNESLLVNHPMIRAIASSPGRGESFAFAPADPDTLDEIAPPETLASILDADSTQRQCVVAARDHRSFVMDGPPGTGKSQTIANMIAELLAKGSTVLFVSEKAPALDVVLKRLEKVGLGEFLLEMHSSKTTRKDFAASLGASLARRLEVQQSASSYDPAEARRLRDSLNQYAVALNRPREPLGLSVQEVLGRLVSIDGRTAVDRPESAATLHKSDLIQLRHLSTELANAWGPVERGNSGVWRELSNPSWCVAHLNDIRVAIDEHRSLLARLRSTLSEVAAAIGLTPPASLADAQLIQDVVTLCAERPAIHRSWLTHPDLAQISLSLTTARSEAQVAAQARTELTSRGYRWDLSHDALTAELGAAVRSLSSVSPDLVPLGASHVSVPAQRANDIAGWAPWIAHAANDIGVLSQHLGVPVPSANLDQAREVARLGQLLGETDRPPAEWFEATTLTAARAAVLRAKPLISQYIELSDQVASVFNEHIWALDIESFFETPNDVRPALSRLSSEGRRNRKDLTACSKVGELPDNPDHLVLDVRAAVRTRLEIEELAATVPGLSAVICSPIGQDSLARFDRLASLATAAQRLAPSDTVRTVAARLSVGTAPDPGAAERATTILQGLDGWESFLNNLTNNSPSWRTMPLAHAGQLLSQAAAPMQALAAAVQRNAVVAPSETLADLESMLSAKNDVDEAERDVAIAVNAHRQMLGPTFSGLSTDWAALEQGIAWATRMRAVLGAPATDAVAREIELCEIRPDHLLELVISVTKAAEILESHFEPKYGAEVRADHDASFDSADDLLLELREQSDQIEEWARFARLRTDLEKAGWSAQVASAIRQGLSRVDVAAAIERAVLSAWADEQLAADPDLQPIASIDRDELVERFRALDANASAAAVGRVADACNARRPTAAIGAAGVIQREAIKKKRHLPIRELVHQAGSVILDLKPCMLMSPLAVSQYLPADLQFDVVIFDEASQVRPCDAANSVYRGRTLIVAGDAKQLPPTTFFERDMDDGDEWEEGQLDDFESLLDLCKASGSLPSLPLRWHYRSQHESLITYSNLSFYESGLVTFPSSAEIAPDVGLEFIRVDGVYDRGGGRHNVIEAQKVAERVMKHAVAHPDQSLGVVAFSDAQAQRIEVEIEAARRERPELDAFFAPHRLDGFFVKNLESVQGDERDTILFSIGYGPDAHGKFTMNFGPLNRDGGERRLNVAITRARRRVEVIASFDDTMMTDTGAVGVRHLKGYLAFARQGLAGLERSKASGMGDVESPFEEAVVDAIRSWGYEAVPQVGQIGYRIDIGIPHPDEPGRFVLGVECDGAAYHSSRVARDRDRLRQSVLEGLGWELHRIWGPAWYRHRDLEQRRLKERIDDAVAGRPSDRANRPAVDAPVVLLADETILDVQDAFALPPYVEATVSATTEMIDGIRANLLEDVVREIVRVEGPVSRTTITSRIRLAAGAGRMTAKRQSQVDNAISRAIEAKSIIETEPAFFAVPGMPAIARSPQAETVARGSGDVSIDELTAACADVITQAGRIQRTELSKVVSNLLGWQRQGGHVQERIGHAIDAALADGTSALTHDGWIVTSKSEPD